MYREMWESEVIGTVLTQQGRCQHGAIAQYDTRFELLSVQAESLEASKKWGVRVRYAS